MNDFLLLSLLFFVPTMVVYAARPDLRVVIGRCAIASVPFAASERFFAGSYWSPPSLFHLIDRVGFGIEDVIFVVAIGGFMTTAYPFFFRMQFVQPAPNVRPSRGGSLLRRGVLVVGVTLGGAVGAALLGVPMLYACLAAMLAAACGMIFVRRDLALASLFGAFLSVTTYAAVCFVYAALRPGVFLRVWHTERFLHRFLFGIPLEELLYGFASGLVAAVFYPFVANLAYARAPRAGMLKLCPSAKVATKRSRHSSP